jgi:hypothetical protein
VVLENAVAAIIALIWPVSSQGLTVEQGMERAREFARRCAAGVDPASSGSPVNLRIEKT